MCDDCDWESSLHVARELAHRGSRYGEDTADWIEENEHVTEAQAEALERLHETWGRR